ncbi:MAG: hypothetical protein ACYCW6_03955 [Candidatus Xenobia bacterium]
MTPTQFNLEFFVSTYLAEHGMEVEQAALTARDIAQVLSQHPQLIVNGVDYERVKARVG